MIRIRDKIGYIRRISGSNLSRDYQESFAVVGTTGTATGSTASLSLLPSAAISVLEGSFGCESLAFFFFFNNAAATAFLTPSLKSRLFSRYSLSSKRCFFPARTSGSELGSEGFVEDKGGSMPSLRSRASSLAFSASALAAIRSGSC